VPMFAGGALGIKKEKKSKKNRKISNESKRKGEKRKSTRHKSKDALASAVDSIEPEVPWLRAADSVPKTLAKSKAKVTAAPTLVVKPVAKPKGKANPKAKPKAVDTIAPDPAPEEPPLEEPTFEEEKDEEGERGESEAEHVPGVVLEMEGEAEEPAEAAVEAGTEEQVKAPDGAAEADKDDGPLVAIAEFKTEKGRCKFSNGEEVIIYKVARRVTELISCIYKRNAHLDQMGVESATELSDCVVKLTRVKCLENAIWENSAAAAIRGQARAELGLN
ncbi:unnamed protein product, partial [Prorocentrum cordatum]